MASTNKTSNYELSQFLGSDKPAWLTDYNADMGKIDAQMKLNADSASGADGKATANATAIGTLANLTTDVKTDLVSAVNEVDGHADIAQNTASSASTLATTAKNTADAIAVYLNLTKKAKITATISGGTVGNIDALYYAVNDAGTYGKVYGRYRFTKTTAGETTITLPIADLATVDASFTIEGACMGYAYYQGSIQWMNFEPITVNTNGTVTITIGSAVGNGATVTMWFPPCVYYFENFGD